MGENIGLDRGIDEVHERLREEFAGRVDAANVDRIVDECARRFDASRIVVYVPVLVEKAARERLRARPGALAAV